jgi:hypothetical protein
MVRCFRGVHDLPFRLLDLDISSYLKGMGLVCQNHLRASYFEIEVSRELMVFLNATLNISVFIPPLLEATI